MCVQEGAAKSHLHQNSAAESIQKIKGIQESRGVEYMCVATKLGIMALESRRSNQELFFPEEKQG
jgi:hypothetical protein